MRYHKTKKQTNEHKQTNKHVLSLSAGVVIRAVKKIQGLVQSSRTIVVSVIFQLSNKRWVISLRTSILFIRRL
jgi:hypothetical protein